MKALPYLSLPAAPLIIAGNLSQSIRWETAGGLLMVVAVFGMILNARAPQ